MQTQPHALREFVFGLLNGLCCGDSSPVKCLCEGGGDGESESFPIADKPPLPDHGRSMTLKRRKSLKGTKHTGGRVTGVLKTILVTRTLRCQRLENYN